MKRILFLAALTSCLSFAQPSRQAAAIATHKANTVWQFVEIETTVHRAGVETSSATKRLSIESGNIYSFELVYGPAKGEGTSNPKLIYRDKEQPNYESGKQ